MAQQFVNNFFNDDQYFSIKYESNGNSTSPYPSHNLFIHSDKNQVYFATLNRIPYPLNYSFKTIGTGQTDINPNQIGHFTRENIFSFQAERIGLGQHSVGTGTTLSTHAGNLAEVLSNLNQTPINSKNTIR